MSREDRIDVHVHPATEEAHRTGGAYLEQAAEYFGRDHRPVPIEETVERFEAAGVTRAVLLGMDHETNTGNPPTSNDWIAEQRDDHDLFLGFASVDPHKGQAAIDEARRAVETLDLDGFKFQQAAQAFFPNDPAFDPLWETLEALGKPALFHGGTTGIGAGAPGGMGIRLKYTKPIPYLDDVAARYPDLPIIIAHPAWPWHREQLAVCMHKANVYMDLSGWRPKYVPDEVVRYARTRLQDKVLFGSDYPLIDPGTWLEDFEAWDLPDAVRRKVLAGNAKRLLGL